MAYLKEIVLREVPRSDITKQLEEAARNLAPDPGAGHKGPCRLYRKPKGERGDDPWPLVCRGQCEDSAKECRIVHVETPTGSHSDLYFVLVTCECAKPSLPKPKKPTKPGKIIVQGTEY